MTETKQAVDLDASIESLGVTAMRIADERTEFKAECGRLRASNAELREALEEVRELIEGYVDVNDGDAGQPVANKAMRAVQLIDAAIGRV